MKLTSFFKLVLIGAVLTLGAAGVATAADHDKNHTTGTQADWTTTLNVKLALLNKLGTDSLHIDVDSMGNKVTLSGMVDKRETSELATTVAKSVKGVTSVNNNVKVEATAANTTENVAGEAEAEVKDAMLETRLRLALIDQMGSDGFRVGTEAASGVVTLEFERDFSSDRRRQAVSITERLDGVSKVVSVDKK